MQTTSLLFLGSSWAYTIVSFFRRLGAPGLFFLGALDSSFLVLPFGNDFLLIALVSTNRGPIWIVYVLVSALGSLLGVFIVDLIMRKAGEKGLEKFVKPKRLKQLKKKMNKSVGWVIFTSTLMPPPFPFTPVIISASALQVSRTKLYGGVFAGRLVRFTIEALLAIYFGKQVLRFLNSPIVDYVVYGLILVAVIGSVLSLLKWLRSNKQKERRAANRKRQKNKGDRA
ncbi:MAG: VTT domain-containing protein [Blastocatellia bacterium]|nr:VTT domain-containing protein [Blastocatellia bacterium]